MQEAVQVEVLYLKKCQVPDLERATWVHGAEASGEMVLEGTDGAFGGINAVDA